MPILWIAEQELKHSVFIFYRFIAIIESHTYLLRELCFADRIIQPFRTSIKHSRFECCIIPNTEKVIEYFLTKEQEPEQGDSSCASLSRLGDRYGGIKPENACTRMLNISSNPSVRNISSLLKNYVESDELKNSDVRKETGGGITRGASAFAIGGSKR